MRKNFNELSTVKDMIENGFTMKSYEVPTKFLTGSEDISYSLERKYSHGVAELNLLIKYYSGLGMRPKKIKEIIKTLWVNYNPVHDYKIIDTMIKKIRTKKDYKLIEIEKVEIPKSIINWIKDMCELIEIDELRREKIDKIELSKILFTIYVWRTLQNEYKEYGIDYIYLDNLAKLKKAAYLKQPTRCNNAVFILRDSGLIGFEIKNKIISGKVTGSYYQILTSFIEDIPEEIKNDNDKLILTDLNNLKPGKYFEEFLGLPDSRAKKEPLPNVCPKCGKPFERKSHRRDELCADCRAEREREKDKLKKQRKREKLKQEKTKEN